MFGLFDLELYIHFFIFLVAIFFSWFIPGWVALQVVKIKDIVLRFLLALPVGLALWGVQGYVFGYTQTRFLTIIYLLCFAFIFFKEQISNKYKEYTTLLKRLKQKSWFWIPLIILSAFLQIFGHIGSGLYTAQQGLSFYFVNSVDGVLHLSYIQELVHNFPPQEPGAVGLALVNYHYWSDLVQAELIRIWHIPITHLFFQYAPILISIWTILLILKLISSLGGSQKAQIVALFLFTFGGDAAYLLTQLLHQSWGSDVSSLDSGVTFYFNIPQVYARFVFIAALFLLKEWWNKTSLKTGILLALLIASLFGFKVYYALYTIIGFLSITAFTTLVKFKQELNKANFSTALQHGIRDLKKPIIFITLLTLFSLLVYLPVNKAAGGLTYSFFEWPHLLLSADNIGFDDWFLRMQVYKAYDNTRNIIIFNLLAVALTFIAVYGTRMIGMLPLFKVKNEYLKKLLIFFIPVNIVFILLGLLTLQTSGGLNIFNFLIVPIFSFNLIAALNLDKLKTKFFIPVFLLFAVVTVPRSFLQLNLFYERYSQSKADAVLTQDELAGFSFLRTQTNAVVQKSLSDHYNFQTPYVAFMSGHSTYISGISMLNSHNQPTENRINALDNALTQTDVNLKINLLKELGITHFILETEEFNQSNTWFIEPVFQNETITIVNLQ